jgi:thiol-disulfide isomerase/thioredoxin
MLSATNLFKFSRSFLSSNSSSLQKLTLLTSDHCTLCVHFKKQLSAYLSKNSNFIVEEINIKSDKELFEKYKFDIPVLLLNNQVLLKHRFSSMIFEENLETFKQC